MTGMALEYELPQDSRHRPALRSHTELARDHIAQRIAYMGARRIRFIDIVERVAAGIDFPVDSLKVENQLLTAWIDRKTVFAHGIAQQLNRVVRLKEHLRGIGTGQERNFEGQVIADGERQRLSVRGVRLHNISDRKAAVDQLEVGIEMEGVRIVLACGIGVGQLDGYAGAVIVCMRDSWK